MDKFAVIMAGGSGTRLWPLSRENLPKQFICLGKEKSMLAKAVERLNGAVSVDKCYIVTNSSYKDLTIEALGGIVPASNIILEPVRKNTAACVTYAVLQMKIKNLDGIVCCIPSDSYISDEESYRQTLDLAFREAEKRRSIIVIGISPSYPATGYGYIKAGTDDVGATDKVFPVLEFVEKPPIEKAGEYVASGQYLWNSGIVIGTMDCILDSVKNFLPDMYEKLSETVTLPESEEKDIVLKEVFSKIKSISFDHGVLEKSSNICVVKGDFGWSDLGSLDSLQEAFEVDLYGNAVSGTHIGIDTTNSVIYGMTGMTATIGLENMIIINTGDIVFACPKERAQEVRQLVELLKQNGHGELA